MLSTILSRFSWKFKGKDSELFDEIDEDTFEEVEGGIDADIDKDSVASKGLFLFTTGIDDSS